SNDMNRGIVDLGQRGNSELLVGNQAREQNCRHQQRRCYRPQNKGSRRTHSAALPAALAGVFARYYLDATLQLVESVNCYRIADLQAVDRSHVAFAGAY